MENENRQIVDVRINEGITESHYMFQGHKDAFFFFVSLVQFLNENPDFGAILSTVLDLFRNNLEFREHLRKNSYTGRFPDFEKVLKNAKPIKPKRKTKSNKKI